MDAFNDREKLSEDQFLHNETLAFKTIARRNHLFGLWAAEQIGLANEEAESYARSIIGVNYCTPDGKLALKKVLKDFKKNKINVSKFTAEKQLEYLFQDATSQIFNE